MDRFPSETAGGDRLARSIAADLPSGASDEGQAISVWLIEDDRSNLHQVVAAMAVNGEPSVFDYVLIPQDEVRRIGFDLVKIDGETPDDSANRTWHFDLRGLTESKLRQLGNLMMEESLQKERMAAPDVLKAVARAVALDRVPFDRIRSERMKKKIRPLVPRGFLPPEPE